MIRQKLKIFLIQKQLWGLANVLMDAWSFLVRLRHIALLSSRSNKIWRYLETHEVRKLQIGSGKFVMPGWLNTDISPRKSEVMFLDARRRMPFDNCTFDYIFSEHVIEHIDYLEGEVMLRECFRVLKPGGKLRIATPDLRFLIELYNPNKTELQKRYIAWSVKCFLSHQGINQDTFVINNFFRAWGHKFIYDFKVLEDTMRRVGFVDTVRCHVGESRDPNLRALESQGDDITDEFNQLETLIIEACKPA